MPLLHRSLCSALLAATVAACAAPVPDAPVSDTSLTLQPQQEAPLSSSVRLRYEEAVDSRCPDNVKCIWAGTIKYRLTLSTRGASETLEVSEAHNDSASTLPPGLHIALASAEPPPRGAAHSATPDHPIVLHVFHP